MLIKRRVLIGKMACVLAVIPVLIYAHEYGPDPSYTGAPGDNKTACVKSLCHVGTVNSFGGSVTITAGGTTYVPGVPQQITVTVADPAEKNWGFQLTARLASEVNKTAGFTQPGDFEPLADGFTQVICTDTSIKQAGKACAPARPPFADALQYIEHTLDGNIASTGPGPYTFAFTWTPPATASGNIILYAAANASNGSRNVAVGHIYTSTLTLSPTTPGAPPAISPSGVVNGATFTANPVGANTYITIGGTNLATSTRQWGGSDFENRNRLPTSLDGTSVTVNGKPAYVEFISPTQINAITPPDTASGSGIPVVVTANGQSSTAAVVTYQSVAPSLFAFAPGTADNNKYPAAGHQNGTFVGKNALFPLAPSITTPAQRNETITLYATGFGATTPALGAGLITPATPLYPLTAKPTVTIGGVPATVVFAGLAPNFAQVYQFNVTVPNVPDGDQPLVIQAGGLSSQALSLTVQGAQ
jgi:uncharacterized protein (TIGR03437 family)